MFNSKISTHSGISDLSYVSGLSNISAISAMKSGSVFNSPNPSNPSDDVSLEDLVGSEYYISPEMLEDRTYTYASDIWALGIMIYQFFVG